jgi:hypothetical protein
LSKKINDVFRMGHTIYDAPHVVFLKLHEDT